MAIPLSVIFAGTPDFACPTLEALLQNQHFEVPLIITQPDKPVGRDQKLTSSPVKAIAKKNNIFIQQPEKIAEIKAKIVEIKPDFLVVVAYGQIIPEDILKIPSFGCINIHASLLPQYRGASPIQEAILHGDRETGITFQLMNKFLDQGDIIEQYKVTINPHDTYLLLAQKLSKLAAEKLSQLLINFSQGKLRPAPQKQAQATYCRKIVKEDGLLDFNLETAEEMIRKIRAYTPWPGCYTFLNAKRIKIIQAEYSEQKIDTGKWAKLSEKQVGIGTKKGSLLPLILQPEGKKEMTIEEFIRGYF